MQKWNLLKKTAPCILSLAVAATTFPTAVMASDLDAAVVSEAEAGDTEDFVTEDTTEDTAAVTEAAADETEDIQQEDAEAVENLDETAEEADPFSTGEEDFTEGDEVAEAFSDSDQLTGEYQYVYAGLTWGEYWAAEGVYAAGDTSSSEEKDSHSEFDTGAFDTVTRATANHGLHRGSYQTEATIIAEDGTRFDVSYWEDKGSTLYLTDGSKVKWNRGSITTEDGKTYTMDHYEIYGLKYVPVAVKTADFADFCKKYNVVQDGAVLSGGYSENNLQYYKGLVADVNAQTNGLKYVEKNGDGFTFTARKSDGTASGIKDQALKTATGIKPSVKAASGSYGEFLRVDLNGNYGDLGANMQAVRWDYYGDDSTYTKCLASYGTKFAADNWMHKAMGIQLGLTKSARCKLPGGTNGTGYWKLTVYALGYNDYTYSFQATEENIVNPTMEPTDFTSLKTEVEAAKALTEKDYTIATWKSFAGELQEAEDILAKTDASQAEVNEALEHLQGAEKELQKVTVTLDKAATVYTGKTKALKATTNDSDAIVTFKSGNTKVATVSSKGVVKGVKAGTAVITAKVGNATATCKVTVKASTIKFAKASVTIYKGKTATVKAAATPSATVNYTSSNTKVATVNSKTGVIKGIKAGTVTITAKAGTLKTTCKVVIKNPAFSLVKSSATIKKGKTTTIRSKAAPAGKITYTSSNKKVAAVNSKGVVKGIKKGKATITVKCNGITKKFVVTVK
ncbi:penicillin-binding Tp47 domain C-containing protein [Blautia massiliensis (ex Durand et al. 2017)]|uniref:penicillin-binding Tp47 domain C-containing protein n=1 Tax=Blautia massiliensis (ex Durand et al. 2017) TaxID=1737424 RepID=UPI00241EEA21|nr:penicillin-binding Tp47 domain C-containing protein [Blautia massiliensis (ex Durand et al. 2017)]MBN2956818.1 Ig-like domain-containing protein [Blautia massiliensis (ex Durand et al. 2017)]